VIDNGNAGDPVNVTTSGSLTTAAFTTALLTVGTHAVSASYGGDAHFDSSSGTLKGGQVVNKANTTTAVVSSPNSAVFGQSVTFTAIVTVNGPGSTLAASPTGTVTFYDGSTSLGQG